MTRPAPLSLKARLLGALAGTTCQQPIATEKLYPFGGSRGEVETALQALHEAREACCCMITRGGTTRVMWWVAGQSARLPKYGRGVTQERMGAQP